MSTEAGVLPGRDGRPLIVLAGLPAGVCERTIDTLKDIKRHRPAEYISVPFKRSGQGELYQTKAVDTLIRASAGFTFRSRQHQGTLSPSRFFLIYFRAPDEESLLSRFDYFAFPKAVEMPQSTRLTDLTAMNALIPIVRDLLHTGDVIKGLEQEIVQKKNKTSLLLPPKNFQLLGSSSLLQRFKQKRTGQESWTEAVAQSTQYTSSDLPRVLHSKQSKKFFCDARGIVFPPDPRAHPPARSLPEEASLSEISNLLNALYRFGMPIEDGFHFDAQRVARPLSGEQFFCIKKGPMRVSGDHANIYPNDFVRPETE